MTQIGSWGRGAIEQRKNRFCFRSRFGYRIWDDKWKSEWRQRSWRIASKIKSVGTAQRNGRTVLRDAKNHKGITLESMKKLPLPSKTSVFGGGVRREITLWRKALCKYFRVPAPGPLTQETFYPRPAHCHRRRPSASTRYTPSPTPVLVSHTLR